MLAVSKSLRRLREDAVARSVERIRPIQRGQEETVPISQPYAPAFPMSGTNATMPLLSKSPNDYRNRSCKKTLNC